MGKWATGTLRREKHNLDLTNTSTSISLRDVIRAVVDADIVGLDLETTGLDPRGSEIRLAQIYTGEKTFVIDCRTYDKMEIWPLVEALGAVTVIAHNAAFEWAFLYHHFGVELMNI